jgi:hypothetical protein
MTLYQEPKSQVLVSGESGGRRRLVRKTWCTGKFRACLRDCCDDFVSFRHTKAWPVLGPYMGRVSPECTVIRPVRGLTYD